MERARLETYIPIYVCTVETEDESNKGITRWVDIEIL